MKDEFNKKFIEKNIAFITAIISFFASILGLLATKEIKEVISITTGEIFIENSSVTNNYFTDDISVAEELRNAENAFLVGEYSYAIEVYKKYKTENAVAVLNLGYIYSTGVGCDVDFDKANKYYIYSYELGLNQGLENLLAMNFLRPESVDKTLEVLKYGIENQSPSAQKYSTFLLTGKIYSNVNNIVLQNSKKFEELSITKQKQILSEKIVETNHTTEYLLKNIVPENANFKEYELIYEDLQKYTVGSVSKLENNNSEWMEIDVPIYDYNEYNLYIVRNYNFEFSDIVFSEKFYKV